MAARLRELDDHRWYDGMDEVDSLETAIGYSIGQDWQDQNWWNRLADLIEPEPERTCTPETEVLDTVDIGIGFLERLVDNCSDCGEPLTCDYSSNTHWRRVLPNYCPNCGAKVVDNE